MKYKFGQFEIDTKHFSVTESGEVISVEPKVFDLIIYLIERRQHIVSRDELFAHIWLGREVSDTTLSNHIKTARKILGDNGDLQHVIKTVRGRGYQFIQEVEEASYTNQPYSSNNTNILPNSENGALLSTVAKSSPQDPILLKSPSRGWLILGICLVILIWLFHSWMFESNESVKQKEDLLPFVLVTPFSVSSIESEKWQPFADQMTRELIRDLRHFSGVMVVPAGSAFAFQDDKSFTTIREKLPQVTHIVDVMIGIQANNKIRINADLVALPNENIMWDKTFETKIDNQNFFSTQSDIATTIANALGLVIGEKEQFALRAFSTNNIAAYELYVAGQQQLKLLNHDSLLAAIELFSQAILLDPLFDRAYVARADAYRLIMSYFEKPIDILPFVVNSIHEALKLKPDSAEALSSLGLAYILAWRFEDAWKMLSAAKHADPKLAQTELGFALYYSALGDKQKVRDSLQRAKQLDPLNVELADWGHWALAMVGDVEAAIKWSQLAMQLHPEVGMIYSGASVSASMANQHQRAISLAQKGLALDPKSPYAYLALAQTYGYAGQKDKILGYIEQAKNLNRYMCPYETAINYLLLEQFDDAFAQMDEAINARSNCLVFTRNDSRLNVIKQDPRYQTLLIRIGLDNTSVKLYTK